MTDQTLRELLTSANISEDAGGTRAALCDLRKALHLVTNLESSSSSSVGSEESIVKPEIQDVQDNEVKARSISVNKLKTRPARVPEEECDYETDSFISEKPSDETNENNCFGRLSCSLITFKDIIGLEEAKSTLIEILLDSKRYPNIFTCKSPVGACILLYGPPGVGKTMLVQAISGEMKAPVYSIAPGMILSKYHGEAENLITQVFAKAKSESQAIIFFDEIDSFVLDHGKLVFITMKSR